MRTGTLFVQRTCYETTKISGIAGSPVKLDELQEYWVQVVVNLTTDQSGQAIEDPGKGIPM